MRSVLYRFPDVHALGKAVLGRGGDLELGLPAGASVEDGEWVLAIFELGPERRATSAAARAALTPEGARLVFEPRDWQKLTRLALGTQSAVAAPPRASAGPADDDAAPDTTRSRSETPSRPIGSGARVLVVDDDADIRDVVSAMLEAVGLVVVAIGSGEEALDRVRSEAFDLLVLDWNLPKMSGLDLCRALRRGPEAAVPVLFLTANASSQDMVDAFACGADDYVVKPFRAPELGARIFSLLRRARRSVA